MVYIRSILPVLFLMLLHNPIHAQEQPSVFTNKIPDSLSLQLKDTDGDGVNDDVDKCINEKGPVSNFGCPVITESMIKCRMPIGYAIFFEAGTSRLSPASVKRMKEIVKQLNDNPRLYVTYLAGHSDGIGDSVSNMKLSLTRIEVVKAYLERVGIDKNRIIQEKAYGSKHPIADNMLKAGRAMNRRVEIDLNYKYED